MIAPTFITGYIYIYIYPLYKSGICRLSSVLLDVKRTTDTRKEVKTISRCTFPLSFFKTINGDFKICPTGTTEWYDSKSDIKYTNPVLVPCGKCMGCRLDNASQWTFRILAEMRYHDVNSFVTLTYDEEHLNRSTVNPDLGTLSKRDVQLFFKRLRKKYPDKDIRYYVGAEYGPQTMRPHYHAIIFGYFPEDAMYWKTQDGNILYTSDELAKLWSNGFVSVGKANELTAGYCARYCTSKLSGAMAESVYTSNGLVKPFQLASRAPALGYRYFYDNLDKVRSYTRLTLPTDDGAIDFSIPRYFWRLLEKEDPAALDKIKFENSEIADAMQISEYFTYLEKGVDLMEKKDYILNRDMHKRLKI